MLDLLWHEFVAHVHAWSEVVGDDDGATVTVSWQGGMDDLVVHGPVGHVSHLHTVGLLAGWTDEPTLESIHHKLDDITDKKGLFIKDPP